MRKTAALLVLLLGALASRAQNREILTIQNDSADIILESLTIEVQVVGNIATTSTQMTFYNPNDRVLEGELSFPLAEGQSVFRFAMDVNGKLREGVAVEKQLGRKAFEGVVRQTIDPGLLEATIGNNYKARVYPIPANGRKNILIAYEEELKSVASPIYQLLLDYGRINHFSIKVEVVNQEETPVINDNELANFQFKKWQNAYLAEHQQNDFDASGLLSFAVPSDLEEKVFRQQGKEQDYFYVIARPPKVERVKKEMPASIGILWDASRSMQKRELDKELELLEKYLSAFREVKVQVIKFANEITDQADFSITKNKLPELLEYIRNTSYDGGTNLQSIPFQELKQDELLLFSDGISNLAEFSPPTTRPIYPISSKGSTNGSILRAFAEKSGGTFINLLNISIEQAVNTLFYRNYQFLYAEYNTQIIGATYPFTPQNLGQGDLFTLSGRIESKKSAGLTLYFGLGGRILASKNIEIPASGHSTKQIDRIWAQKKVKELLKNKEERKEEIIEVARAFNLVTPYTSLIVLDRVEDYIRYQIDPPAELKVEYDLLLSLRDEERRQEKTEIIEQIIIDFEDRLDWWKNNQKDSTRYVPKEEQPNPTSSQPEQFDTTETQSQQDSSAIRLDDLQRRPGYTNQPQVDTTIFNTLIEGVLTDDTGEPLIGANLLIKGTQIGTVTDIDGSYRLWIREHDTITINYVGYRSKEITANDAQQSEITLNADVNRLEEVVVVGYGVQTKKSNLASSIVVVQDNTLRGSIPGVQMTDAGQIRVRGMSTLDGKEPMYIVDGIISDQSTFRSFSPDQIHAIQLIDGAQAAPIYGAQAQNGLIIVSTKNGIAEGRQLPDSIQTILNSPISINEWNPDEPYLDTLQKTAPEDRYPLYLELSQEYGTTPSFFLAVGSFFLQEKQQKSGLRILSNIVELELENHELLKILAHKYRQLGQYETSIYLFEKIEELRPDEPHSKRDLALACQAAGQYQRAQDLLLEVLLTDWQDREDRFPFIKSTVLHEMNNLISLHEKQLDLSEVPKQLIRPMPVDIRIVLDWNLLETDIDLWVTEPSGEKCFYNNYLTLSGGRLTEDFVDGYGPEEYILKNATPGEYLIEIDFFDDRVQKISGPVTLQVSVFLNYGRKNQVLKEMTLQLKEEEGEIEVGRFVWE